MQGFAANVFQLGLKDDVLTSLLSKYIGTTIAIDCTEREVTSAELKTGGSAIATHPVQYQ